MGVASVAGGGDCGSDSHSCESVRLLSAWQRILIDFLRQTYYYKWMAYHHSIMFLGSVGLMFWAGSFCAARLRGLLRVPQRACSSLCCTVDRQYNDDCADRAAHHSVVEERCVIRMHNLVQGNRCILRSHTVCHAAPIDAEVCEALGCSLTYTFGRITANKSTIMLRSAGLLMWFSCVSS